MELTHRFTVPGGVEETWERFGDIADVAQCFPGAQVTSAEGDSFEGTVKVKLGPIALVYAGSGRFVSRDEAAHSFVVEAKGRDKRGNGTAGATVTVAMSAAGSGTDVQVDTDLSITGKPAQFGRGVMQDVSDKLLGQFVACLEQRSAQETAQEAVEEAVEEAGGPEPQPAAPVTPATTAVDEPPAPAPVPQAPKPTPAHATSGAAENDAIDLGATVLPVLVRSYWRQAVAALGAGLAAILVVRRVRRR